MYVCRMDMQLLRYAAEALPRLFPQLQYLSLPETVDIFAAVREYIHIYIYIRCVNAL